MSCHTQDRPLYLSSDTDIESAEERLQNLYYAIEPEMSPPGMKGDPEHTIIIVITPAV